jgi:hypothetical protein
MRKSRMRNLRNHIRNSGLIHQWQLPMPLPIGRQIVMHHLHDE